MHVQQQYVANLIYHPPCIACTAYFASHKWAWQINRACETTTADVEDSSVFTMERVISESLSEMTPFNRGNEIKSRADPKYGRREWGFSWRVWSLLCLKNNEEKAKSVKKSGLRILVSINHFTIFTTSNLLPLAASPSPPSPPANPPTCIAHPKSAPKR